MQFIKALPVYSLLDDNVMDVGLWESAKNICEFATDPNEFCVEGNYYGTTDEYEPKFCAKHFFGEVVSGDGKTNYKLITEKEAQKYL